MERSTIGREHHESVDGAVVLIDIVRSLPDRWSS